MIKHALFVVGLGTSIFSFAQEEEATTTTLETSTQTSTEEELFKSKKGYVVLPQAGDIAIGFNAAPLLDFALNAIKIQARPQDGIQARDGIITSTSNYQVVGKYFLSNNTAVRARFGVNSVNGSRTNQVQDAIAMAAAVNGTQDDIDAASLLKVKDQLDYQKRNVNLVVGYEKRRGYGRLQGFYGGELGLNFTKADAQASYGNEFSDVHDVEFTEFIAPGLGSDNIRTLDPNTSIDTSRFLSQEFRGGLGFGLRAFIGVEYFFARKMSVAVEYGWGYSYTSTSAATRTDETYHNGQNRPVILEEKTDMDESSSEHNFGNDNNASGAKGFSNSFSNTNMAGSSGSITLLLHF